MLFTWNRLLRRQLGIGRQFEQSLREEVERNRRFLDGIPSPIFVVGLEGELLTCNKSYEERLSVQLEQIRGLKVTDVNLFPEEVAEQFQQELMCMIHSRKPCYKNGGWSSKREAWKSINGPSRFTQSPDGWKGW